MRENKKDYMQKLVHEFGRKKEVGKDVRVEYTESLSVEEVKCLFRKVTLENVKYNQYVYTYSSEKEIRFMQERIRKIYEQDPIFRTLYLEKEYGEPRKEIIRIDQIETPIKDISNKTLEEQTEMLKGILAAEARRNYNCEKNFIFDCYIYKLSQSHYVVIVSICTHPMIPYGKIELLRKIWNTTDMIQPIAEQKETRGKTGWVQAKNHWIELLKPLPSYTEIPGMTVVGQAKNESLLERIDQQNSCALLVGKEIKETLENISERYIIDIRTLLLCAWGLLLCEYHAKKRVIFGMCNNHGKLDLVPIDFKNTGGIRNILTHVNKQITELPMYDLFTGKELEETLQYSSESYLDVQHNFLSMSQLDAFLQQDAISDYILDFDNRQKQEAKLIINYHLFSEELVINYIYDCRCIQTGGIEELHNTWINVLKTLLKAIQNTEKKVDTTYKFSFTQKENKITYEEIMKAQKALYIKQTGYFEGFDLNELMDMADASILRSYPLDDVVLREKELPGGLYIIGDGKVEISKHGVDGYERTIQILKQGNIFGLESVLAEELKRQDFTIYGVQSFCKTCRDS